MENPLRPSSLTVNTSPLCLPNHVSQCHIYMALDHFQRWWTPPTSRVSSFQLHFLLHTMNSLYHFFTLPYSILIFGSGKSEHLFSQTLQQEFCHYTEWEQGHPFYSKVCWNLWLKCLCSCNLSLMASQVAWSPDGAELQKDGKRLADRNVISGGAASRTPFWKHGSDNSVMHTVWIQTDRISNIIFSQSECCSQTFCLTPERYIVIFHFQQILLQVKNSVN